MMTFEWIALLQAKLVFIIDVSIVTLTINAVNDFWQVRINEIIVISQCDTFFLKKKMNGILRI